jgi:hypothetical protein
MNDRLGKTYGTPMKALTRAVLEFHCDLQSWTVGIAFAWGKTGWTIWILCFCLQYWQGD